MVLKILSKVCAQIGLEMHNTHYDIKYIMYKYMHQFLSEQIVHVLTRLKVYNPVETEARFRGI